MITRVAFLLAALFATPVALAQPKPGVTTRADVRASMGEPDSTLDHTTLEGDLDLFFNAGADGFAWALADPDKRFIATYDVMEYPEAPTGSAASYFVFASGGDKLLYAVVKPSPSEATLAKAKKRYGKDPVVTMEIHRMSHMEVTTYHYIWADEGIELTSFNDEGRIDQKIYVKRDKRGRVPIYR